MEPKCGHLLRWDISGHSCRHPHPSMHVACSSRPLNFVFRPFRRGGRRGKNLPVRVLAGLTPFRVQGSLYRAYTTSRLLTTLHSAITVMHCDAIQLMANRNLVKWGTQQVSILPKEFPSAALKPQMTLTMGAPPAVASDGQAWPEPLAACRADVCPKERRRQC